MLLKNLKTKSLGLYILILLNLLLLPFYSTRAQNAEEELLKVLSSLNLSIEEINVNSHVSLENQFFSSSKAEKKSLEIAEKFSLENYTVNDYSTLDNTEIILQGNNKEFDKVTVIVQATDISDITETNIVVDVVTKDSSMEIKSIEEKIKGHLKGYKNINFNSNITASHEDRLTIVEQKEVIKNLMKKLEAKEVEIFTDGNVVSVTGYSRLINEWRKYGGKKINLNVATRYNSFEDKTNLWLGTPFITIGY